jgi:hypothetical protein
MTSAKPLPDECREAFEKWYSNGDVSSPAIRKDARGEYVLMQAYSSWTVWQACWNARPAPTVPEWRPIESAPRDGRAVLLCGNYGQVVLARYYEKEVNGPNSPVQRGNGFWAESWDDKVYKPTHWMPLPAAPENKGGK